MQSEKMTKDDRQAISARKAPPLPPSAQDLREIRDELRRYMVETKTSMYRLVELTGVPYSTLRRFLREESPGTAHVQAYLTFIRRIKELEAQRHLPPWERLTDEQRLDDSGLNFGLDAAPKTQ